MCPLKNHKSFHKTIFGLKSFATSINTLLPCCQNIHSYHPAGFPISIADGQSLNLTANMSPEGGKMIQVICTKTAGSIVAYPQLGPSNVFPQ